MNCCMALWTGWWWISISRGFLVLGSEHSREHLAILVSLSCKLVVIGIQTLFGLLSDVDLNMGYDTK